MTTSPAGLWLTWLLVTAGLMALTALIGCLLTRANALIIRAREEIDEQRRLSARQYEADVQAQEEGRIVAGRWL